MQMSYQGKIIEGDQMGFLLVCSIVALIFLCSPAKKNFIRRIEASFYGAAVITLVVLLTLVVTGEIPIMPDDCIFSPQTEFCKLWVE